MFYRVVTTTLMVLTIAASFCLSTGAPYYGHKHAYHLQKGWVHHPVLHVLGHGPLSHWAHSLNGHVKHGLHSLKHAALGLKHELKHGGLLGLKHGGFTKHGGFVKHADFGHGHVALNAYGGVVHHPPPQYYNHNYHAVATNGGSPLSYPELASHDVIGLNGHGGVPLGHSGLASHDVIALSGHGDAPLVFPEHGSDVRPAVPLSEYGNFPSEG